MLLNYCSGSDFRLEIPRVLRTADQRSRVRLNCPESWCRLSSDGHRMRIAGQFGSARPAEGSYGRWAAEFDRRPAEPAAGIGAPAGG